MKNIFILVILFATAFWACENPSERSSNKKKTNLDVITEYHSNGKIKSETSVSGQLRQGITKNYDREGRLLSELNYVNNVREGMAKNYYPSGKLNSTLEYKNGIKEGNEIWYYESGKEFRVSPFVNGKIDGIQKLYYESGQLMAEVPYKEGYPGIGLKEYQKDGILVTDYPRIVIDKKDYLTYGNKILLQITLSNNSEDVTFYKGSLTDGKYLNKELLALATLNGFTQIDYNMPKGTSLKQNLIISCKYKTPMGNPLVISRAYSFQAVNQ
jgi:antitoxin component YwqK of YwqJK toxin-antitoxin module